MKKVALILLAIVVAVILIAFILKSCEKKAVLPPIDKAQYSVHADNRYYMTSNYESKTDHIYGKYLLLHGYWDTNNGTDWVYHKADLKLSYRAYPTLAVAKRVPQPTP